jgi:hypothetical protein
MRIIVGSALGFGALVTGAAFRPSFWSYAVVAGVAVPAYLLRATSSRLRCHRAGGHRLRLDVVETEHLRLSAVREAA